MSGTGEPLGAVDGPVVVGVDIGGTKVALRAVAAQRPAVTLAESRVDTPPGTGDALVAAVADAARALVGDRLVALGVGVAGLVTRDGVVRYSPNLPGVEEYPLRARLAATLGGAVVVDNDATVAALAEWRLGAGVGHDDLIMVTLGTGIGGGLVVGGRLQRGAHGFAGEPGHMIVDPGGARCACGGAGCWEAYASGSALARLGTEAAAAGEAPTLAALVAVGRLRGEDVAAAAVDGDAGALAVLDRFAWWVALGLANLTSVLDCSLVVVGGGLIELGELLLAPLRRHLASLLMGAAPRPPVAVVAASLGAGAGSAGAALAAAEAVGATAGDGGSVA